MKEEANGKGRRAQRDREIEILNRRRQVEDGEGERRTGERLKGADRQISISRQKARRGRRGRKKERGKAEGHMKADKIYRKQTEWGIETERRRGRG